MAEKKPVKKWAGGLGEMEPGDKVHSDFIDPWACLPIGAPVPVFTHITGVSEPPTDRSYRYIKLTASDSYNSGVLTSESVSGSAPLVIATAVIAEASSPLAGATVHLINTERRALRAGSSGTVQADALQNITGSISGIIRSTASAPSGAFTSGAGGTVIQAGSGGNNASLGFNASLSARTDVETRNKNIGADYYMRIL